MAGTPTPEAGTCRVFSINLHAPRRTPITGVVPSTSALCVDDPVCLGDGTNLLAE